MDSLNQPGWATNGVNAAAANADDQLVFESTIEARLEEVRHELSAAIEETRVLSMRMATNKAPEAIPEIASVLSENQRLVKDLERERFDIALRRLEFRAIRKAMQK